MYQIATPSGSSLRRLADGAFLSPQHPEVVAWLAAGNQPQPYQPPDPTANDVRVEAQRRIVALVGATDVQSCLIKQLNANMRANELNDIQHSRELTVEEAAEANALRSLAIQIKAIRAASNVLEPNPPQDYTDEKYWP